MINNDQELNHIFPKGHLTSDLSYGEVVQATPPGWSGRETASLPARQSPCRTEFLGPEPCLEFHHSRPGLEGQAFW